MPHPRRVAVAFLIASASLSSPPRFLVVSSRKHKDKWVLPKGGIEDGEDAPKAAERESWEEAGLLPNQALHLSHLALLPDAQPHKKSTSEDPASATFIPSTTYSFELFSISDPEQALATDWPERQERERKWVEGWETLEKTLAWGRREQVMRNAIKAAKARMEE